MSTDRCNYCGFPADTPSRAHDFIHQQGEALIEHRKEMRRLYDLSETLRAENAALREALEAASNALDAAVDHIDDPQMRGDIRTAEIAASRAARPQSSQSNGECYAIALHPDGTSTDLKKPYCRDCGSNDVSMEGGGK